MGRENEDFDNKINAILRGEREDSLTAVEFVRYLLKTNKDPETGLIQNISREQFSAKFGRSHYFTEICVRDRPGHRLPRAVVDAMANLTGTSPFLWRSAKYTTAEAKGIIIDMTKEVKMPPKTQVIAGKIKREGTGVKRVNKTRLTDSEQNFLTFLPQTAKTVMIDQETGQWQRDTFLIDAEGTPTRHYRNAKILFEGKTPEQAIADIFDRDTADPLFAHKGHFMRRVVAEAKKNNTGLAINVDRTQSAIQVQPHDKGRRFL